MSDALDPCCDTWEAAHKDGTDGDGYGVCITYGSDWAPRIGGGLPPIQFCPWCGRRKNTRAPDQRVRIVEAQIESNEDGSIKSVTLPGTGWS